MSGFIPIVMVAVFVTFCSCVFYHSCKQTKAAAQHETAMNHMVNQQHGKTNTRAGRGLFGSTPSHLRNGAHFDVETGGGFSSSSGAGCSGGGGFSSSGGDISSGGGCSSGGDGGGGGCD